MPDYISNIRNSGLSIYDEIAPENRALFIPLYALERILSDALIGESLNGLPLRTRSNNCQECSLVLKIRILW